MHYPLNTPEYKDEVLVFLGASYFRAVGKEGQYKVGDNATLKVNQNRMHLFDQQSSQSLLA